MARWRALSSVSLIGVDTPGSPFRGFYADRTFLQMAAQAAGSLPRLIGVARIWTVLAGLLAIGMIAAPSSASAADPLGYWPLNEGAGQLAVDAPGSGPQRR